MNKYRAKRTEVDGITFASQKEAVRYQELRILERIGKVTDLKLQPRFPIYIAGQKVCEYVADFTYIDLEMQRVVIEDVKGMKTPIYRLKKKLFEAAYSPLRILEI